MSENPNASAGEPAALPAVAAETEADRATDPNATSVDPIDEPFVETDKPVAGTENGSTATATAPAVDPASGEPAGQAGAATQADPVPPSTASATAAASGAAEADDAAKSAADRESARLAALRANLEAPGHQVGSVIDDARGCLGAGLHQIAADVYGRVWRLEQYEDGEHNLRSRLVLTGALVV